MSDAGMGAAAERALAALLQARGMSVRLRVSVPASGGDDTEQLGIATPAFEDVALGRCAFRKANSASRTQVLLVAAGAVEQAGGSAEAMFARAAGVVIDEALYGIEACEAMRAGDGVYGYALTLVAPLRTQT